MCPVYVECLHLSVFYALSVECCVCTAREVFPLNSLHCLKIDDDKSSYWSVTELTHWGRVMHICVNKLTIIYSNNGLSPDRRQAIIWTNAGILLIGPLGTNFSEILIEILTFSFKNMHLKVSSAKQRPFCLGLNVLTHGSQNISVQPVVK